MSCYIRMELMDGNHLELKRQRGETIEFLAPSGALLWLRDKTRGKEEQVFIYENGRQWFVSDI